jgi:hypothetical protein
MSTNIEEWRKMKAAETTEESSWQFSCACRGVVFRLQDKPVIQNWCHCKDCRKWNQRTPVGMVVFPESALELVSDAKNIGSYNLTNAEFDRFFCKLCGYRLYNKHQKYPFVSIPSSNVDEFEFEPQSHVFCVDSSPETLKPFHGDGLPRYTDLPALAGGTGKLFEEEN